MNAFDRVADKVADLWAHAAASIAACLFVILWLAGLAVTQKWNDDVYHLWLNSPTTALTFGGIFFLHNTQHRFEQAQNERWDRLFNHLGIEDPVDDEGQKP